jgi:hypothetical protein
MKTPTKTPGQSMNVEGRSTIAATASGAGAAADLIDAIAFLLDSKN